MMMMMTTMMMMITTTTMMMVVVMVAMIPYKGQNISTTVSHRIFKITQIIVAMIFFEDGYHMRYFMYIISFN